MPAGCSKDSPEAWRARIQPPLLLGEFRLGQSFRRAENGVQQ